MKVQEHQFIIPSGEDLRVDKFLAEQLPDVSRSQIKNLIESGNVILDDIVVEKAGAKARPGSVVRIDVPVDDSDGLVPEDIPLDIIYEDDQVIVINKPSGMVVHPGAGNQSGTAVNALLAYYPPIRSVGETDRPGVVHRLDKETSGVLIFAKTQKAYKWLVKEFKTRDIDKAYLALVDGQPPTPTGRIEAPIIRDPNVRTRMAVGLQGQGKPAVTEYFTIENFEKHTYLEAHPITGRTHQIRVHLSYLGTPVVGDSLYGHRKPSVDLDRFFLHARMLTIRLPGNRGRQTFEAPLPPELQAVLDTLHNDERKPL
ncbi:MAG: RluA family pseudouridine synthase [Anaerolineaceae bacterium]|nr:RluA family pseudouridine synthase [Anaerolineaceae bacterium]